MIYKEEKRAIILKIMPEFIKTKASLYRPSLNYNPSCQPKNFCYFEPTVRIFLKTLYKFFKSSFWRSWTSALSHEAHITALAKPKARQALICIFVLILVVILSPISAFAQTQFSWGPYLRIWHEFWKNPTDLNSALKDNSNLFKIKTSFWGQVDFNQNNSLYVKLSNENNAYTYLGGTPSIYPDKQPDKKGYHYDFNEIFFENLYTDVKNFMGMPVDLRLGRQDLAGQYGEGFLIMDGTTGDASRTVYFNAAKASWRIDNKNTLDAIYINDPRTDQFLPVINRFRLTNYKTGYKSQANYLTVTDEQGYVLYWKNTAVKNLGLEGYYIFKGESEEGGVGIYSSEKTKLNTIGSYIKYDFTPYALRAQAAGQWGSYGKEDRTGLGGYVYLDRDITELKAFSPSFSVGWFYLSGDNRKTDKQEGWDPLFSRDPWLSELYIFALAGETGIVAYWTNIQGLNTQFSFKPTSKSRITLGYLYLRAVEAVPSAAGSMFSGNSKDRGQLFQSKFDYNLNKYTTLGFLCEYFFPGRFYAVRDDAFLLRSQLEIKF